MFKKIAIGFAVLIIVVVGALGYLGSNLDSIVKAAIEKYGTAATQSEVRVDSVRLSISTGEGSLNGLSVANPKGFSSAKALSMGTITVKLDTGSVAGNGPIIIREIAVDKAQVTFEANNSGDSNLQTIERNATANKEASKPEAGQSEPSKPESGKSGHAGRKVIITDLYIRDGQIDITHPLLKKPLAAPLPTIHLTNIGKDSGGASPAQVADLVLKSITSSATKIASSDLIKNIGPLKNLPGGAAGNISDKINGLIGR